MRFLERTAEKLQLENDILQAELAERDQKYEELMADFEMTEDFRCQVETENAALKAQVANLTNLLEETLDSLEEAVNEADDLEYQNKQIKLSLAELQLNSNNLVIKQLVQSLKAAGIIPQQTEVRL